MPGFGILQQNGGEIPDWKSMHGMRDAVNNRWVIYGTGLNNPIGAPQEGGGWEVYSYTVILIEKS